MRFGREPPYHTLLQGHVCALRRHPSDGQGIVVLVASDISFPSRVAASVGQLVCELCYWAFGVCCTSVILGA